MSNSWSHSKPPLQPIKPQYKFFFTTHMLVVIAVNDTSGRRAFITHSAFMCNPEWAQWAPAAAPFYWHFSKINSLTKVKMLCCVTLLLCSARENKGVHVTNVSRSVLAFGPADLRRLSSRLPVLQSQPVLFWIWLKGRPGKRKSHFTRWPLTTLQQSFVRQ